MSPGTRADGSASLKYSTPWTSDAAQLPTPTIATRTEPIAVFSSLVETKGNCSDVLRRPARSRRDAVPFGGDQLVEPSHLALHRLEPMLLELHRVAVELLPGATERARDLLSSFLEPGAPALEDLQPDVGVGLREESEAHPEALVLPRRRTTLGELLLQPLLALGGELVDDPAAPTCSGFARRLVGGEQAGGQHLLEAGVERAVGDRPQGAQQGVDPLAQLVAVQRRLVQQAEDGELQHAGPLAHRVSSVTESCRSDVSS